MKLKMISNSGRKKRALVGWSLAAIWLVAVLAGFAVMINYDLQPGAAAVAPRRRPVDITPALSADRPTLLLFAHPRCPCTRATVVELNHILTACPGAADVRVYFTTPAEPTAEWTKTALWDETAALPDTTALPDPGGALARQFDVKTSGHVLLYSAAGKLLFSGGITAARGEEGANPGRIAVVTLLQGQADAETEFLVFGCPLFDSSDSCTSALTCPTP